MERSRLGRKKLAVAVFAISFFLPRFHTRRTRPWRMSRWDILRFIFIRVNKGYTIWMNGGSGSFALNANHWFGVAGDFGGYLGHIPQSLTGETYIFGPRFSYRQLDAVVPFAQALLFSESSGGITGGRTQFTFALGGGADIGLGSSRKFAVRLEGDYFGIRSSGSTTPSLRLSAGIVYRIGSQ
jgi:hypothetical protein